MIRKYIKLRCVRDRCFKKKSAAVFFLLVLMYAHVLNYLKDTSESGDQTDNIKDGITPQEESQDKNSSQEEVSQNDEINPEEVSQDEYFTTAELTKALERLQEHISKVVSPCRRMVRMGGLVTCKCHSQKCNVDGAKLLCLDEDVRPIPRSCRALNFGIGSDMSFDRALAQFGCRVAAFDPTSINMTDTVHSGGMTDVHALRLGIDERDHQFVQNFTFLHNNNKIEQHVMSFLKYQSIIEMLDDPVVHLLKLDIEGLEWKVLRQILNSSKAKELLRNTKQLMLEIHLDFLGSDAKDPSIIYEDILLAVEVLEGLKKLGFHLSAFELNEVVPAVTVFGDLKVPLYREISLIRRKADR